MKDNDLEKLQKRLGKDTVKDMETKDPQDLKSLITEANNQMSNARTELKANPKYTQAKSVTSVLESGLKAVNKRQNDKIAYALHLLDSKGALPTAVSLLPTEPITATIVEGSSLREQKAALDAVT